MTVQIKKRLTKKGEPRYLVYYRKGGGREAKTLYAGSFQKRFEAQHRRDLIAGELALGRDPRFLLATLRAPEVPEVAPPGLLELWELFIDVALDVGDKATAKYGNSRDRWVPILGADRDPHTITPADIQAGIVRMVEGSDTGKPLAPATVAQYLSPLAMLLDHCDIDPNPARSHKVKLPRQTKTAIRPPSTTAWFAIRDRVAKRSLLPLRLIECCGLRVGECCNLTFGDVDFAQRQIRIMQAKTASGQRWVPVPQALLDQIADLCPTEDRTVTRRLFNLKPDAPRRDLAAACILAGTAAHHPHELRHRRLSLWYRNNFDPVRVKTWAGHSKTSMGLDTYGHVILDPADDEWQRFWLDVYHHGGEQIPNEPAVRGAPGGHSRV